MINKILPIGVLLLLLVSCQGKNGKKKIQEEGQPVRTFEPKYAKGYSINYYKGYKELILSNPWDENGDKERFLLVQDTSLIATLAEGERPILKTPVTKWIPLSSTMISYVDLLGNKSTVCGVAEPQYISDEYIKSKVSTGEIRNVGMAFSPDYEVIVDLEPDFVMVSPFKDNNFSALKSAGIPIITNADYLEHTPLGRAEWLIFVAALFDKEDQAIELFNRIEQNYLSAKTKAGAVNQQPSVFTGHLYQGVWHTPAGESYMANFFKDAGVNYIYKDTKGTGSLSLDFETIFDKAHQTDKWVVVTNYPGEFTYQALRQMDERYADFAAFTKKQVIVTNTSYSLFYEKGILQPDVVLNDLIHAFHPELDPNYQPVYFHQLK